MKAKSFPRNRRLAVELLVLHGPLYLWLDHRLENNFEKKLGPAPILNDASHVGAGLLLFRNISENLGRNTELGTLIFGSIVGSIFFSGFYYFI